MILEKKDGKMITVLRAWALTSIVSAHCTSVEPNASFSSTYAARFMNSFGSLGVALFFFISGYLFAHNQKSFRKFWHGKLFKLFIPWFVSSSMVYLYVVIRKGGFSIGRMFLFVIGYSSSYWFMLSLVLLYLLFFMFRRTNYVIVLIVLSLIYRLPLGIGLLPSDNFFIYINPINWFWAFGGGILGANINLSTPFLHFHKRSDCLPKTKFLLAIGTSLVYIIILLLFASSGKTLHYTHILYPAISLIFILSSVLVVSLVIDKDRICKSFSFVGERSYSVYLYHELGIAGVITAFFKRFDAPVYVVIRPLIVIVLTIFLIEIARFLARKMHVLYLFNLCIGSRSIVNT